MSDHLRAALRRALLRLLDSLAPLLLEAGIGTGEFHELTKDAYVRAARRASTDRRDNYSRLAVLTGLTRSEVTKIAKAQQATPDVPPPLHAMERNLGATRAERVLRGWWTDEEFLDARRQPAVLPLRGKKRSFAALVDRYAGGPGALTVLRELVRVKAVRRNSDRTVEALSRTFATVHWDAAGVEMVGERLRDFSDTLTYNLKHPSRPRYARFVVNSAVDPKYIPLLVRQVTDHLDVTADHFQDTLSDPNKTIRPSREPQEAVRFGVGVFLIEQPTVVPGTDASTPATRKRR